jgi:hypothetical protein
MTLTSELTVVAIEMLAVLQAQCRETAGRTLLLAAAVVV